MNIIDDPPRMNICLFDSMDFYFHSLRHIFSTREKANRGKENECDINATENIYFQKSTTVIYSLENKNQRPTEVSVFKFTV